MHKISLFTTIGIKHRPTNHEQIYIYKSDYTKRDIKLKTKQNTDEIYSYRTGVRMPIICQNAFTHKQLKKKASRNKPHTYDTAIMFLLTC